MATKTDGKQDQERQEAIADFKGAVNMSASQIATSLDTDESKEVGHKKDGEGEFTGHEMGRAIVRILGKRQADDTDDDLAKMRRVTGYVKRHTAQRPDGDVTDTPWRSSLMNWCHDPKTPR